MSARLVRSRLAGVVRVSPRFGAIESGKWTASYRCGRRSLITLWSTHVRSRRSNYE